MAMMIGRTMRKIAPMVVNKALKIMIRELVAIISRALSTHPSPPVPKKEGPQMPKTPRLRRTRMPGKTRGI